MKKEKKKEILDLKKKYSFVKGLPTACENSIYACGCELPAIIPQ